MKNPPLKHIADELSKHGRYGDTMLVHMNPREVEGIASLVPGGKLTINPVTGQPEAFLPFLVPLLGSWLGSAAAGAGMLGGLGTLAGSAIGSGLATTLATGDLEQGLISGITGFGLGSALSGLGGAAGAAGDIASGTGNAALAAVPDAAQAATNAAQNIVGQAAPGAIPGAAGAAQAVQGVPMDFSGINGLNPPANVDDLFANLAKNQTANMVNPDLSAAIQPNKFADLAASATAPANTLGNNLMAPLREPGQFLKNMTDPKAFLPFYVGEGTNASIRAQEQAAKDAKKIGQEEEGQRSAAKEGILRALERVRTDYGMFAGGQVDYATGGSVTTTNTSSGSKDASDIFNAIKNAGGSKDTTDYSAYVNELYGKYGSPSGIQSSLRGTVLNTPPAFDYNALYSGGSGYAPGVAPEFMFFGQAAPSTGGGTGGGTGGTGGGTGGTGGTGGGTQTPIRPGPGFTFPQSNFGYIQTPATSQEDIQSILDRLTPSEDQWWRDELAKQPARQFAEGGPVDAVAPAVEATANPFQGEYDNLVQSTIAAIKGEVENPEAIINQFVQEYGNEAFMQLREQVLQGVQPGAQTQGLVDGPGGGMDDLVQGSIADGRPVAVSPGEYIVPADVVSAAGDGHTGGGAKFFDDLIESIRVSKNGTAEQPKPMKELMG